MQDLDEIFIAAGTDKSSLCHWYSKYYTMFFESLRHETISLLEWGVDSGFSLRSWRRYFTEAKISGIDIRGDYEYLIDEGCTATYIVDQKDESQVRAFGEAHINEYDIIIDDCTHDADDMIRTFEIMFPALKANGYYVIEDTLTSADKSRWGRNANVNDRIHQMISELSINGKVDVNWLCSNKVGEIHKYEHNLTYFERHIEFVFVSYGMTIIKKMP